MRTLIRRLFQPYVCVGTQLGMWWPLQLTSGHWVVINVQWPNFRLSPSKDSRCDGDECKKKSHGLAEVLNRVYA